MSAFSAVFMESIRDAIADDPEPKMDDKNDVMVLIKRIGCEMMIISDNLSLCDDEWKMRITTMLAYQYFL